MANVVDEEEIEVEPTAAVREAQNVVVVCNYIDSGCPKGMMVAKQVAQSPWEKTMTCPSGGASSRLEEAYKTSWNEVFDFVHDLRSQGCSNTVLVAYPVAFLVAILDACHAAGHGVQGTS